MTLSSGKTVVMVALTVAEMLIARRAAGSGSGLSAAAEASMAGARQSVKAINGEPVAFVQLMGGQWDKRVTARETMQVLAQFNALHAAGDAAAVLAGALPVVHATEERTLVTVAGLAVELRTLPFGQVQAALAAADKEGSPAAQEFIVALEGLRRSIVSIDGTAFALVGDTVSGWPLDVGVTNTLAAVWRDLHGLGTVDTPTVVPTTV